MYCEWCRSTWIGWCRLYIRWWRSIDRFWGFQSYLVMYSDIWLEIRPNSWWRSANCFHSWCSWIVNLNQQWFWWRPSNNGHPARKAHWWVNSGWNIIYSDIQESRSRRNYRRRNHYYWRYSRGIHNGGLWRSLTDRGRGRAIGRIARNWR